MLDFKVQALKYIKSYQCHASHGKLNTHFVDVGRCPVLDTHKNFWFLFPD